MVGRPAEVGGRLVIVDLQGMSDSARQIVVALLSTEILNASFDKSDSIRPVFLVYEEGHNFAQRVRRHSLGISSRELPLKGANSGLASPLSVKDRANSILM